MSTTNPIHSFREANTYMDIGFNMPNTRPPRAKAKFAPAGEVMFWPSDHCVLAMSVARWRELVAVVEQAIADAMPERSAS